MMQTIGVRLKEHRIVAIVVLLAAGSAGVFGWVRSTGKEPTLPTFQVQRAEFLDVLQFRGELKALKTVTILAPPDVGSLQILKLTADGTQVKKGDVVVEFDPSKTTQDLAQDNSALKSAEAETEQARAQGRLKEEENTTAVMKAKYDVEVAKLDASKGEILSRIEGAEAKLKVSDAEQAFRQAEEKQKSDRSLNEAAIDGHRNASSKARFDAERAAHALASMVLRAPADGAVSLIPVWHDGGEAPFKAGERVWSGSPIAQLPDSSSLHVTARVDETERGRLAVAQTATIQLDAIADRQFTGKLERIGTIAAMDFSAGWPIPRNFALEIGIDQNDPRLKPGMTAQITVIVDRVPNAISIPAQALFVKSGRTVAYVWSGSKFEERGIQIERRSRDRALISNGLKSGDMVALKDPSVKE
jgi:RND family efflux transporter MFP subunit